MGKRVRALAKKLGYELSKIPKIEPCFESMQKLLDKVEKPIIFDVGAHQGVYSVLFRKIFPTSVVYAFEPFGDTFSRLKENTASDPSIHPFNFGFSNREGTEIFHSNMHDGTNSLFSTNELSSQTWGEGVLDTKNVVQAEFKTIDSFISAMAIPRIDLLKIDVQGAEYLVMEGAARTCKKESIQLIYNEIITQPTYDGQKRLDEVLTCFYDSGFDLFDIYNLSHTKEGRLRQVDTIFTKRN